MQWLDLSAYGDIHLRVRRRESDPPVMFVMEGGDAVGTALTHSGFRRTGSGMWFRSFEPADVPQILRWLTFDLPDAVMRETDPAEILQGYVPAGESAPVEQIEADPGRIPESETEIPDPEDAGPADPLRAETASEDEDLSGEANADRGEVEDGAYVEGESFVPRPFVDAPFDITPFFASGPDAAVVGGRPDHVVEEESRDAAAAPVLPDADATVSASPSGPTGIPEYDEALAALARLAGRSGASARERARQAPVEEAAAEEAAVLDFAWAVSAGADDARRISGLERLGERNHLVAKLARREDAPEAAARRGRLARDGDDGAAFRIVAVVHGIDGSGFGDAGDVLVVGDPGDGLGALVDDEGGPAIEAA